VYSRNVKYSLQNVLTAAVAVGWTVIALELCLRIVDGVGFGFCNYVSNKLSLLASEYPSAYDPLLGYVPRPSYRGTPEMWHTRVTINSASLRQNRTDEADLRQYVILAVGDSYTFGDEVSDEGTWPAELEQITGLPVANGGVFGYGLDQIVLRAEALVPIHRPSRLIVSFFYEDVHRNYLRQRTGVEKPYFDIVNSKLVLRNVPPSPNRPHIEQIGFFRAALGYSYLADWSARRLGVSAWWYAGQFPKLGVDTDGTLVACLLMDRLKALEVSAGISTLVVAQYWHPFSKDEQGVAANLLKCAEKAGLATLDTRERLLAAYREDSGRYWNEWGSHMTATGNLLIAREIAKWVTGQP
jgi:hypothetical protein